MIILTMCLSGRKLSILQVRPRCQTVSYAAVRLTNTTPAFFFSASKESSFCVSVSVEQLDPRLLPVSQPSLLFRKQWLSNWFDAGVNKPLEDLARNTEQRYLSIIFWVPHKLHWLWDCDYKRSSPDLGNFESLQAGRKKVT